MASWGGHTLPGTFFIVFGIYYLFTQLSRYFKYRSKRNFNYYSTFQCCGIPFSILVIEGCVKIFFISVGTLVELFYPGAPQGALHADDGNFTHPMNWQHATMYMFFGLSGLTDIIAFLGREVLPQGIDRIGGALALFIEGYLFFFHLDGRSIIDTRCHILLVLTVWPCALFAFLEVFFTRNRIATHILQILSTTLLITQGVWFWMVAYILYPPDGRTWDPCHNEGMGHHDDNGDSCSPADENLAHLNVMFLTMFWSWALAFVIVGVMLVYFVLYKWHKMRRQLDPTFHRGYSDELMNLKAPKQNGMSKGLLNHQDDDEDAF